jgi:hypothetical protein
MERPFAGISACFRLARAPAGPRTKNLVFSSLLRTSDAHAALIRPHHYTPNPSAPGFEMRAVFRWQRPVANEKEERNSETQIQDPP